MNTANNSNFARPEQISRDYAYLDLELGKLKGKESYDGQLGGFPLMHDSEKNRLVVDSNDNHTLVFGASGSKKTRTVVLPSIHVLAAAEESMIIHDAKGELYDRTAQMLKDRGYRVVCINLRDPATGNAWNPLAVPYEYYKLGDIDKAAEFTNDVACTLMQESTPNGDPFWANSATDCCYGLILLLMRYCKEYGYPDGAVNMANVAALRRSLFKMQANPSHSWLWGWGSQDELIAGGLSGTVMTANETMQGILSTLDQKLRTFTIQPALLDMLANNSIDIRNIGVEKTAVFLITPDEKAAAYRSLVALFVSQSYQQLIYYAAGNGGRVARRVNYILDEFSSLPAIGKDSFPSMITAARSRNIRFLIVAQSKHQLKSRYGTEADTIMANCANWIVMFTRELELLREVSELCGQQNNGKPNISVFDLQHFSKEKNEVLLMAGRNKPAVVCLLDIKRLDREHFRSISIETPERAQRVLLDFSKNPRIEELLKEQQAKRAELRPLPEVGKQETALPDLVKEQRPQKPEGITFNVDDLIRKIDAKIEELEREEREEKAKLEAENSRTKLPLENAVQKNGAPMDDFSKLVETINFDIGEEKDNKRKDRPKKGFLGFFKREKGSQLEREEK